MPTNSERKVIQGIDVTFDCTDTKTIINISATSEDIAEGLEPFLSVIFSRKTLLEESAHINDVEIYAATALEDINIEAFIKEVKAYARTRITPAIEIAA